MTGREEQERGQGWRWTVDSARALLVTFAVQQATTVTEIKRRHAGNSPGVCRVVMVIVVATAGILNDRFLLY